LALTLPTRCAAASFRTDQQRAAGLALRRCSSSSSSSGLQAQHAAALLQYQQQCQQQEGQQRQCSQHRQSQQASQQAIGLGRVIHALNRRKTSVCQVAISVKILCLVSTVSSLAAAVCFCKQRASRLMLQPTCHTSPFRWLNLTTCCFCCCCCCCLAGS
jgi:hypothetical protein